MRGFAPQRRAFLEMIRVSIPWLIFLLMGMAFYTGDRFPEWKNNVFVGALLGGAAQGYPHLERIVFDQNWDEVARQSLLTELRQRIRDVRQGPDGLLYVLTDEENGALIRLEPAQ